MKNLMIVSMVLGWMIIGGCESDQLDIYCPSNNETDDSWLERTVRSLRYSDSKAEIYYYEYHGEAVFSVNSCVDCADTMTNVYNCEGMEICRFGGIAGFNTCPDFAQEAKNEKLIWKNY